MKNTIITALIVSGLAVFPVFGQQTMTLEELRNSAKKTAPAPTPEDKTEPPKTDQPPKPVKTKSGKSDMIDDGSYSKVNAPFIFVARDLKTYKMLSTMIDGLKFREDIDFKKFAVVAAFSGEKDTGGYAVSIKMEDGNCVVEDVKPIHGAIVTEALTKPYAISVVPVEEEDSLNIVAGETWKNRMETYTVSSGRFEYSGGFTGRSTEFDVKGRVSVLKFGSNISLFFDVWEDKAEPNRRLQEAGSGLSNSKTPLISRLEAGKLIEKPHYPFKVVAKFEGNKLTLNFTRGERDYALSDGFEGSGVITAEKISAP